MTARTATFRCWLPALLAALPLAASNGASSGCGASSYGVTGRQLPALIRDAMKALPSRLPVGDGGFVPLDRPVTADDVVLIRDFDRFARCQRLTNASQIEFLRKETRMFVLRASFPIYIPAWRRDIQGAIEAYASAEWTVKYQFAAWLGHEVAHAFLHEEGETIPLAAELELQLQYVRQGFLPADNRYLADTRERLAAARRLAESGRPKAGLLLTAGVRD